MFKSGPLRAGPPIDMFKNQDPDAKTYAIATLPTLERHLKELESIAAGAGISAS